MTQLDRHDVQQLLTCLASRGHGGFPGGPPSPGEIAAIMGWPVSRVYEVVILSQGRVRETPEGLGLETPGWKIG